MTTIYKVNITFKNKKHTLRNRNTRLNRSNPVNINNSKLLISKAKVAEKPAPMEHVK